MACSAACDSTDCFCARIVLLLAPADIPACEWWPCAAGAVAAECQDKPGEVNGTTGRTCNCPDGYAYEGESSETGGCRGAQTGTPRAGCCCRCCAFVVHLSHRQSVGNWHSHTSSLVTLPDLLLLLLLCCCGLCCLWLVLLLACRHQRVCGK
jgi:hypothetical protein